MISLRVVGYALLWIGFLAGSFLAVQNREVPHTPWQTVAWPWYVTAMIVGIIGAVALRVGQHQKAVHVDKLSDDVGTLQDSIANLTTQMEQIIQHRGKVAVHRIHGLIDARLREDIARFVEAREALIHTYSMQHYADLMTDFAMAERYVNRAWCASADGYIDEVWSCLELAANKFGAVRERLDGLVVETRAASSVD